MAKWSLTSSNDPGDWWNAELAAACVKAADDGFPNEVCGFIVFDEPNTCTFYYPLRAKATKVSVYADPHAVIDFVYHAEAAGWRVLATFHSHPDGTDNFSHQDDLLLAWADSHVLACRRGQSWKFVFGLRSSTAQTRLNDEMRA